MTSETPGDPWLTTEQQLAWRAYLVGTTLLMDRLDRDLRAQHDLSLPEYEVLVRLSECEGNRLRMATLADSLSHSRSRVTHTVARLERAGLVERMSCASDGRGVEALLTPPRPLPARGGGAHPRARCAGPPRRPSRPRRLRSRRTGLQRGHRPPGRRQPRGRHPLT